MRRCLTAFATLLTLAAASLALAAAAAAAEPPNQNDPCSSAGRNTCGTNGVGAYRTYRFGIRWFGDYRKVLPSVDDPLFCIDLRFWYPSARFRYERRSAAGLRNREGDAVSPATLRRMAYALWREGDADDRAQQGAMMLYVHGLMGDGAPGEAAPDAIGPAVERRVRAIARAADRYAGPYRIEAKPSGGLVVGRAASLSVRVVAASGAAVPNVAVRLDGTGADGLRSAVRTGRRGTAKVPFTPTTADGLRVTARAEVAAALPALYVPTRGEAARSGQRLVGAATATVAETVEAPVKAQPRISTQVSEQLVAPGASVTDSVLVEGLAGQTVQVKAALYGPYPAADAMTCDGAPFWEGGFTAAGDGTYVTDPVTLTTPGYYTYVEWIEESDRIAALRTPCGEASETTVVRGSPAIATQISQQRTAPGAQVTDTVVITGLGALRAPVVAELWGPYPSRDAITCEGQPLWRGEFTAAGDGSYATEPVTIPQAGWYTYRERILETTAFAGVETACGEESETTIARATPKVTTLVSDAVVKPGARIFDRLKVSGLGTTPATVEVELHGPYASREEMDCKGEPYWKGTVDVTGDGEYATAKVEVRRAGFYTYVERIAGSDLVAPTRSACGVEAETSLAAPLILTGRGDVRVRATATQDRRTAPTSVTLPRLRIRAPIATADIDTRSGALAVPKDIDRVGWWRDGAAPGDTAGTILLAGHVDSARRGAGAFYALTSARRGDTVELRAGDGRTRRWRVASVRRMRKSALPTSVFTRSGPRRLVLVTCGGPFDDRAGSYRDNVVVTAVPA